MFRKNTQSYALNFQFTDLKEEELTSEGDLHTKYNGSELTDNASSVTCKRGLTKVTPM